MEDNKKEGTYTAAKSIKASNRIQTSFQSLWKDYSLEFQYPFQYLQHHDQSAPPPSDPTLSGSSKI